MKKIIAILAASLLSSSSFAWVTATAQVLPEYTARANTDSFVWAKSSYAVGNDSGSVQSVAVCYTLTLCPNAAQMYRKTVQTCDKFDLQPGQAKNDNKYTELHFNYPFNGYCDVATSTEIFGWQHKVAVMNGKLHVTH